MGDADSAVTAMRDIVSQLSNTVEGLDFLGMLQNKSVPLGRQVDLVMAEAVRNPYFAASVFDSALDVYGA